METARANAGVRARVANGVRGAALRILTTARGAFAICVVAVRKARASKRRAIVPINNGCNEHIVDANGSERERAERRCACDRSDDVRASGACVCTHVVRVLIECVTVFEQRLKRAARAVVRDESISQTCRNNGLRTDHKLRVKAPAKFNITAGKDRDGIGILAAVATKLALPRAAKIRIERGEKRVDAIGRCQRAATNVHRCVEVARDFERAVRRVSELARALVTSRAVGLCVHKRAGAVECRNVGIKAPSTRDLPGTQINSAIKLASDRKRSVGRRAERNGTRVRLGG